MKITIYTISNDPFCTAEKEYLTGKAMQFEEKNLETNREFLSEMLAASDNFAGVPFTIIIKDDGTTVKMKGFTKEEFETTLSVGAAVPMPTASSSVSSPVEPARPANPQKELEGVLNTLSSMSAPAAPVAQPQAPTQSVTTMPPSSTDTVVSTTVPSPTQPARDLPTIPDFAAKAQ